MSCLVFDYLIWVCYYYIYKKIVWLLLDFDFDSEDKLRLIVYNW